MIKQFLRNIVLKLREFTDLPLTSLSSFLGMGGPDNYDYYTRWIYACVDRISNSIAKTDWELYQAGKKDVVEVENHELLALLYRFNNKFTKFNSLKLTVVYFLIYGEAVWLMLKDGKSKKPKELWVVPPTSLSPIEIDAQGYPTKYRYQSMGKVVEISATDVLILRNPKPNNLLKGMSVVDAIADVAETDYRMVMFNKNLMKNDATISGVLEVPASLDTKQAKIIKKIFDETYAGFENARKTAVLANGAQFKAMGIPPKDLEFALGRNANRDEILAVFGVPKILLGMEGDYNRATAETAERVFAKYTLEPLLTMIIEQINEFFVPLYGDNLYLDFEPLATEDKELQLNYYTQGHNKWLTTNDIRAEIGKDPLIGGDAIYQPMGVSPQMFPNVKELKAGHKCNHLNLRKAKMIRTKVNARNYRLNAVADQITKSVMDNLFKKDGKKMILKIKKGLEESQKQVIWQKAIDMKREYEKAFVLKLLQVFAKQKQEVVDNLDGKKAKLNPKEVMFDKDNAIKSTVAVIEPEYYASIIAGSQYASEIVGEAFIDITTLPAVQKWIRTVAEKYAESITETTYEGTLNVLKQGIDNGQGVAELADTIGEYFDGMAESRAIAIARTETARALTAGQAYEWDEMGINKMEWYLAGNDPCETCQSNSQAEWTVKEAQQGTVEYSHPNCECIFLPL